MPITFTGEAKSAATAASGTAKSSVTTFTGEAKTAGAGYKLLIGDGYALYIESPYHLSIDLGISGMWAGETKN